MSARAGVGAAMNCEDPVEGQRRYMVSSCARDNNVGQENDDPSASTYLASHRSILFLERRDPGILVGRPGMWVDLVAIHVWVIKGW